MERWLKYSILFVLLIFAQLLVFSHLQFRGMVNAFPYIYFIIILPCAMKGGNVLLISALMGIVIDFFSGTIGIHTTAIVLAAYARILLLPMLAPQGNYEVNFIPSVINNGWGWFMRYASLIVLIHHLGLFMVESFTFAHFGLLMINVLLSSILTLITILILQLSLKQYVV